MSQTTALLVRYSDVHYTTTMRRFVQELDKRRRIFLSVNDDDDDDDNELTMTIMMTIVYKNISRLRNSTVFYLLYITRLNIG